MDRFVEMQMVGVKRKSNDDRERLAEERHKKSRAKHKGRCHWRNWERRKMANAIIDKAKNQEKKRVTAYKAYRDEVRKYWAGLRSDMPSLP